MIAAGRGDRLADPACNSCRVTTVLRRADAICIALLLAATAVIAAGTFRHRDGSPQIQDEFVYVFQARLILEGRLSAPSPALPEFFEAGHVIVTPRFAGKYLPGHAVALAPFVAIGAPWLWPCLSLATAAVLLYLALRWTGTGAVAAAAGSLLFLASSPATRAWMTLLSHGTAALCVAVALGAATRLGGPRSTWAAFVLAGAGGFTLLTRPFAGVALLLGGTAAIALARSWRGLPAFSATAAAAGVAVVLTCLVVTGKPFELPWALYARQYMPFDGPGIGKVTAPPAERHLPAHLEELATSFRFSRELHTPLRLVTTVERRATQVSRFSPSPLLLPFALFAFGLGPAAALAAVFVAAFFALQLFFHASNWYYLLECWPALAFLIAAGADRLARASSGWPRALRIAARAAIVIAAIHAFASIVEERAGLAGPALGGSPVYAQVEKLLEPVRLARGLVFFRYPPGWDANVDLGYNEPDLASATLIRALDLGPRNDELRRLFPTRPAFLLDLGSRTLSRLDELAPSLPALGRPSAVAPK